MLKEEALKSERIDTQRWFKEKIKTYGLKSANIGKIAKTYFAAVKNLPKEEVFALCEPLWQSVFQFVMQHRATMSRMALRYAIEKMPKSLKEQAMKKP